VLGGGVRGPRVREHVDRVLGSRGLAQPPLPAGA
jgi:hypothetical protein